MKMKAWGCAVVALAAMALPFEAAAQDRQTRQRIEQLEQQIQDLQGAVYGQDRNGAPVRFSGANPDGRPATAAPAEPAATAALNVRLGSLEQEVQRLTGEVERLSFQLRQTQEQMQRLVAMAYPEYEGDMGLSLNQQRDVVSSGGTVPQPGPVEGGGPVDLVGGGSAGASLPSYSDAESAYAAGRSALLEARFTDAERSFLALIENYPDSERAGDATYYLGETYLAQGDLGASARTFLDFIRNHPDNPRAAEAHLKLGQAFARADKTNEACRVWQRGLQAYPDMDGNLSSRISDMREATCS